MTKPKIDKGTSKGVSKEDCLALGEKALSSFTGDELNDYVSEVFNLATTYKDVRGKAAIDRAMKEINKTTMEDLFHECTVKANNTYKFEDKANLIREKKATVRSMLDYRGKRQSDTVIAAQNSARSTLSDTIYNDNWTKEKEAHLYDKKNDIDTYNALDGRDASPQAKEIAKMIEEFRDKRNAESVRSNAIPIDHLSKFKYLAHTHDATAIMNGGNNLVKRAKNLMRGVKTAINAKESWINYIKERLDLPAMFEGSKGVNKDGSLNHDYIDKTLGNTFENITTGKSELFTRSIVANDRDAVRRKQKMFLYFKDWRSWGEYNERYGKGSLVEALHDDMMQSGGKIGMADMMGDSPASMFMDLNKVQVETGVDLAPWDTLQSWNFKNENTFKYLMGANPKSVRPDVTNFISGMKSFTSAVKAPWITISSITDYSHQAEFLGRQGISRFRAMGELMANMFNNKLGGILYKDRKILAKQFKLMLDSHIGQSARMIDAQNVGSFMNRVSDKIFKFWLVDTNDKASLTSVLHLMSDNMGRNAKKSWDSMNPHLRRQMEEHGFTESEWDLLRTKTKKGLFCLDNVNDLTEQELKEYHEKSRSDAPLTQLKNDLYRKLYSYFDVAAQNSILNPSAFTKANTFGNAVPGTLMGELWGIISQFKSYPMTTMDRVWMQGFENAQGKMAKLMFATRLMAMTMPLSFLSTWFSNWAQGKSMPDMDDPKFWASMALPGFGVFMSIMDPKNQNKDLLFNTMRSPSMALIGNMLSAPLSLISGDTDAAAKRFKGAMKSLNPAGSVPFFTPFINEMLGSEESYLQPGQRQIYGA